MNLVVSDMAALPQDFLDALGDSTGMMWEQLNWQSNQLRAGAVSEVRRYLLYIFKPLSLVFRRDLDRIVFWQQFYGISYGFWSRLFHRRKTAEVLIMPFIYKPKNGGAGKLFDWYIRRALMGGYIDHILCTNRAEAMKAVDTFGISEKDILICPWGIEDDAKRFITSTPASGFHLLDVGRSNRNHDLLVEAVRDTDLEATIIDDTYHPAEIPPNVEVLNDVSGDMMLKRMAACNAVVIPLKDPDLASGQIVLLQAWSFGKPVICTKGKGLTTEYATNEVNCLSFVTAPELLHAVGRLREDFSLCKRLAQNGRKKFEENYTEEALGRNVGQTFIGRK